MRANHVYRVEYSTANIRVTQYSFTVFLPQPSSRRYVLLADCPSHLMLLYL